MKKLFVTALVIISSTSAFAFEVDCVGKTFSFTIQDQEEHKIGLLIAQGQVLQQVVMNKKSVNIPKYEDLKALYEGKTSEDSYKIYIFKEKDQSAHISFLETESVLGHKKTIELRCKI